MEWIQTGQMIHNGIQAGMTMTGLHGIHEPINGATVHGTLTGTMIQVGTK